MITIEIHPPLLIESERIERAASVALKQQSAPDDSELTIVLTDDEQLQDLNRDYRDIDAPTDVLSFPASEADPETGARYLGDILISVQRAEEQAERSVDERVEDSVGDAAAWRGGEHVVDARQ